MNDKTKGTLKQRFADAAAHLGKSKYILILLAVGLLLLILPFGKTRKQEVAVSEKQENVLFDVDKQEEKLGNLLSRIDGAGQVSVMLTLKESEERILATESETKRSTDGDRTECEQSDKTVIISSGSDKDAVTVKYIYPTYRGAVIVAEGADNAGVRLALTEAAASVTGLGTNRIKVIKMK